MLKLLKLRVKRHISEIRIIQATSRSKTNIKLLIMAAKFKTKKPMSLNFENINSGVAKIWGQ